jgi:hypothetical protein
MMVYAHVDKLVDRGLLTADELGVAAPASASVVELAARPRLGGWCFSRAGKLAG